MNDKALIAELLAALKTARQELYNEVIDNMSEHQAENYLADIDRVIQKAGDRGKEQG